MRGCAIGEIIEFLFPFSVTNMNQSNRLKINDYFSDWGCAWFQRTASYSSQASSEQSSGQSRIKRGGSLLKPEQVYLDIEKNYETNQVRFQMLQLKPDWLANQIERI